jgi:hypothetical protein
VTSDDSPGAINSPFHSSIGLSSLPISCFQPKADD